MPLVLSVAAGGDADRIAEIHMAAFGANAMLRAQFPTPAVRRALRGSISAKALADIQDPMITVLVVRDSQPSEDEEREPKELESQVIAFAKWAHPVAEDEAYAEPPWVWPEGTDWEVLDQWTKKTEEAQERAVGRTPCYRLSFIGTDPLYGRRGAASLMLQWGIAQCRKDRAPAYLESTIEAAPFYKKHGFSAVETFSLELNAAIEKSEPAIYEEVSFVFNPLI